MPSSTICWPVLASAKLAGRTLQYRTAQSQTWFVGESSQAQLLVQANACSQQSASASRGPCVSARALETRCGLSAAAAAAPTYLHIPSITVCCTDHLVACTLALKLLTQALCLQTTMQSIRRPASHTAALWTILTSSLEDPHTGLTTRLRPAYTKRGMTCSLDFPAVAPSARQLQIGALFGHLLPRQTPSTCFRHRQGQSGSTRSSLTCSSSRAQIFCRALETLVRPRSVSSRELYRVYGVDNARSSFSMPLQAACSL